MGSATLDLMRKIDENAGRGVETFTMFPEHIRIVTDEKDPLWDPDCEKPYDSALLESFMSGARVADPIAIVNRGKKGGDPDYVVVDGRNRLKCAIERNRRRVETGEEPLQILVKQCRPEDAVAVKIASGTKAKRSPLYWPKMWQHFRGLESPNGSESEEREARKKFMKMNGISTGAIMKWDKLLSAHPSVLQMVEEKILRPADVHDIVDNVAFDDQPEAARKVAERKSSPDSERGHALIASQVAETLPAPTPTPEPKRTKKEHREKVLGIATVKPRSVEEIRALAAALERTGNEAFDFVVAALRYAANDPSVDNSEAFVQLAEAAKGQGWKA